MEKIKQILPTFQVPEICPNMSDEELEDKLAIYIMAFGKLHYLITLKALQKIMLDEDLMKKFRSTPIPTLASESVKLTEFEKEEKERYKREQTLNEAVDIWKCEMIAYNFIGERVSSRKMTPLEYDYWIAYKIATYEEYKYWKDKEQGLDVKLPYERLSYNPKTREIIPMR